MEKSDRKLPSPLISLVPLVVLVVLLFFTIGIFGSGALDGASQIVLMLAAAVCVVLSMWRGRVRWQQIERAIVDNITGIAAAIVILLLIGALSGTWMVSGVVPTLIYYGMHIIHPSVFLLSTCVICSVVSLVTGSSWTTVATVGIALMGIGEAQGFAPGWVAGAIISGAYFGDKMSPLSDTTVLAAAVSGTPIFTHIRYLWHTTIPSMAITLIIFGIAGFAGDSAGTDRIEAMSATLRETFRITPWLLLVPVLTGVLIARKVSAIATLFISTLAGGLFALVFQPDVVHTVAEMEGGGAMSSFKGFLVSIYGSTHIETGDAAVNDLVSTHGMAGMLNTIWLILCAMCFGGAMIASGMLESLTSSLMRFMRRRVGMVASTAVSGILLNICTADQYISLILTGKMFRHVYIRNGYEARLLGRTAEDSVTVTSVLVPWNTCGMTQATVLGVATVVYLPYCFFNLISPLMSITLAAIGYRIRRTEPVEKVPDLIVDSTDHHNTLNV